MMNPTTGVEEDLINVRLKKQKTFSAGDLQIKPRKYQVELCKMALKQNVVIYLGTGLGKTYIVVIYLNEPEIASGISSNRKIVFLAPTQDLIKQQAEYINRQTIYRTKIFCGRSARCGEHIDHWDRDLWAMELKEIDLLFMTPQILAAAIATNILDWSQFGTIIFDEVHHACKGAEASKHPYGQILRHYHSFFNGENQANRPAKPRLIGLTASLINNMPKNKSAIWGEIKHLEQQLEAKCITDLDVQEKRPHMVLWSYYNDEITQTEDILTSILKDLGKKIDIALKTNESKKLLKYNTNLSKENLKILAFSNRLKLATVGLSIKPASFAKVIDGLVIVRQRCGLWALKTICKRLVDALDRPEIQAFMSTEIQAAYRDFVEIMRLIYKAVDNFLSCCNDRRQLIEHARPKVRCLLDVLTKEYNAIKDGTSDKSTFSCVIFVRSRLEVVALTLLLQQVGSKIPEYEFMKADYAVGLAATYSSKYACLTKRKAAEQYNMLKDFRTGSKNVIITTSVLEEGIDLPVCSTVVRYDRPRNFREYVQSRGRARQQISSFVSMCETGKGPEVEKTLNAFHNFDLAIKEVLTATEGNIGQHYHQAANRAPRVVEEEDEEDFFLAKEGSVRIESTTARTIINMYCNSLSKDTPFLEGVRYSLSRPENLYQVTIYLPSICPLADGITGRPKRNQHTAENSACVAAVKALVEAKELDEDGVPIRRTEKNIDQLLSTINMAPNFQPVHNDFLGILDPDGKSRLFKPRCVELTDNLVKNCSTRRYKLIKIKYEAHQGRLRVDTSQYFERCVYGLIVDAKMSEEFLPAILHSHYGVFEVKYQVIDSIRIPNRECHEEYLRYTYKLLTRCLSMDAIRYYQFQQRCLFYIVPLDEVGRPDTNKMRYSFEPSSNCRIRMNDIVRVRYNSSRRNDRRDTRLMLVKGLRGNLVDVAPVSTHCATVKLGKKIDQDCRTSCLDYPIDQLERFDTDPDCIFQAFNKPAIIFQLYQLAMVLDLDKRFISGTTGRRVQVNYDDDDLISKDNQPEQAFPTADGLEVASDVIDKLDDVSPEEDEDHSSDGDDNSSSESNYDSDTENLYPEYADLISKKNLNLSDNGDDYQTDTWDISQYEADNLAQADFIRRQFHDDRVLDLEDPNNCSGIIQLRSQIDLIDLPAKLRQVELKMTSDSYLSGEQSELKNRTAKVDKTIKAPYSFDRNTKPLKEGTRSRALREALTLRRAGAGYSLEGLENIGDCYLKYITSVVLYKAIDGNEGCLTQARSRLTSNKHFTHLAQKKQLGSYAITRQFTKEELSCMLGQGPSKNFNPKRFYNRMRPKDLADMFESIVGACLVYMGEFEAIMAIEWLGLEIIKNPMFDELHEGAVVFCKPPSPLQTHIAEPRFKAFQKKVRPFEDMISYIFNDTSCLIQAFTHATYEGKCTRSYERLEFLGDSIIDFLVTLHLAQTKIANDPGQLTSSRSALVNNYALARLALKYNYDLFISHGNFELYDELNKIRLAVEDDPSMSLDMISFDRIVKLLADVFESVAGAIFIDSGCSLDTVASVYYPMLKDSIERELAAPTKNPTAALYEMFPGLPGKDRITFETHDKKSADGDVIAVKCKIAGYKEFEGTGISQRQAKLRAVREALKEPPSTEMLERLNKDFLDSDLTRTPRRGSTRGRGSGRRGGGRPQR